MDMKGLITKVHDKAGDEELMNVLLWWFGLCDSRTQQTVSDKMQHIAYKITPAEAETHVKGMRPAGQHWTYKQVKEYLATNGKCGNSEFKTSVEDIRETGYSISELDVLHLGSKWWIMYNNAPEQHDISHIKIEFKEDERTVLYGVDFPDWQGSVQLDKTIYFTAEQLFREKEDLIKSL